MIKANELRIGNWISHFTSVEKVIAIQIAAASNGDDYVAFTFGDWDPNWKYLNECKPIPLTPEILEKAGFAISENGLPMYEKDYSDQYDAFCITVDDFTFWRDGRYGQPLKYLHQLQNLFFALTGEELEINL